MISQSTKVKTQAKGQMKLPKELFVSVRGKGSDQYFSARASLRDAAEAHRPKIVGCYKLVQLKTVELVLNIK